MKKILIFASILFLTASYVSAAGLSDIFPKSSELSGGSSAWIASGVTEEDKDSCKLYTNTYTYYSKTAEKILDIQRRNTYMVSVRIFSCDNFMKSLSVYEDLIKVDKSIKSKKQSAPVAFGERGMMLALPFEKSGAMADFFLTFLLRSFVVQVYSDDGFAQMDMAGLVEKRLIKYTIDKGASYFINKMNLSVSVGDNITANESVTFTGDNISTVLLTGRVFSADNEPVKGAVVKVRETSQQVVTDDNGAYKIDVSAGSGKSISIVKMIFLKDSVPGVPKALSAGIYMLEFSYKGSGKKESEILNILVANDKIIGRSYNEDKNGDYTLTGSISGDNVTISRDCSKPNSSFQCRQVFTGSLGEDNIISGSWSGTGGRGSWSIDKKRFAAVPSKLYPQDAGVAVSAVKSPKGFLFLNIIKGVAGEPIFLKEARLNIDVKNSSKDVEVVLYKVKKTGEGITLGEAFDTVPVKDGRLSIDISGAMREASHDGYLLGFAKGSGSFIEDSVLVDVIYYRGAAFYAPIDVVFGQVMSFGSDDKVSNSNNIKSDNDPDIEIALMVSAKGRSLEYIEILSEGTENRHWNSNPFDIYPAVAVKYKGEIINAADGRLNFLLTDDTANLSLFIYKGALDEKNVEKFTVKVIIDGNVYEGEIIK